VVAPEAATRRAVINANGDPGAERLGPRQAICLSSRPGHPDKGRADAYYAGCRATSASPWCFRLAWHTDIAIHTLRLELTGPLTFTQDSRLPSAT
jgi:hypothetical protein